jgi:peptide/nickel transport system substrate-binding protein
MRQDEDGQLRHTGQSLAHNDALTEWTLTLREGVRFHDGTPLDGRPSEPLDEYSTPRARTPWRAG